MWSARDPGFGEQVGEGHFPKASTGGSTAAPRLVADEHFRQKGQRWRSTHGRVAAANSSRRWRRCKDLQPICVRGARGRAGAAAQSTDVAAVLHLDGGACRQPARRAVPRRGAVLGATVRRTSPVTREPFTVESEDRTTPDNVDGARLEALKRGTQRGSRSPPASGSRAISSTSPPAR